MKILGLRTKSILAIVVIVVTAYYIGGFLHNSTKSGNQNSSETYSANNDGNILERLEYITQNISSSEDLQRYQRYDDWNCSANNAESSGNCASGDEEYIGEEATWTKTAEGGTARSVTEGTMTKTLDSNKVYQDSRTDLYWTDVESSVKNEFAYVSFAPDDITQSCQFLYTGSTPTTDSFNTKCDTNADSANNVSANEFCLNLCLDADNADSDDDGATGMEYDWRLPSQKELMQAYINGAANNLPTPTQYFWSSTETYSYTTHAWTVLLANGFTDYGTKVTAYYVRCVRH